ncbi:xaa-Pro dipeptidase isoform X3 [Sitodiplosis mosellana]|uniref:xaa-Pro dipeptidase isoform X3 n=1 Tax=Sitodiplosis mosellana TaxID=263140 RepID=UPI002444494F|nr:xaa-Pro dipeptidase isoform X3 [Sitodiplosis mosellana]XP_055317250.1 xaa-Pro dipeptidase isoform X3 [Sitodiplosis mosellana]
MRKFEPFFTYFFGVREPGFYGAVNVSTGKATLFAPRLPAEYATWMGTLWTPDDFKARYNVDEVRFVDDLDAFFTEHEASQLLLLKGRNSDSHLVIQPASFDGIDKYNTNDSILYPVAAECRVIKSPAEIEVLRYVAKVSSDAHKVVMKTIKPGMKEYECESHFLHHAYAVGGCRHASYTCICGSGRNGSILHYGHAAAPNDKVINDGEIALFDMGANYFGYAADITCSYPVNGKFTDDQRFIYKAVLAACQAVHNAAKPGVNWVAMHDLANRVLLTKLKEGGLLQGEVDDMMKVGINGIFQPHGLGHFLGLDVHDVGGYLEGHPERPTLQGFTSLRFARDLKAGMYVTIEPGCYFIKHLLDEAFKNPEKSKFLVADKIKRFENFGGVRIEDDVLITETGCENFAIVPRTVEEIEAWMTS